MSHQTAAVPGAVVPGRTTPADQRRWLGLLALGALVVGVGLRLFVLATGLGATDSDESVIGLIALRATRGDVDVLFWGQAYGGTIESLVAAPLFALFGPSVLVERLLLLVIAAVAALLTWRIGRRLVGEPAATIGAALQWTTSSYFVWWSTKINIYYGALCLALVVHLLLLRLQDEEVPKWWPAAFGLAAGAAAWSNPQTMYLLIPATLLSIRPLLRRFGLVLRSVPFVLIGWSPWLIYSVRNDWSTLRFPGVDVHVPYPERVVLFVRQLPIVFGLRLPISNEWLAPPAVVVALAVGALAGVAWVVVRNRQGGRALVALTVAYALLFGLSPQVGQPGASLQPRYLLFVTPVLMLLIATVVASVAWRKAVAGGLVLLALATASSAVGLWRMEDEGLTLTSGGPGSRVPADIDDLTTLLDDLDVRRAYSFYWLAYRTTFETRERVIVAPAFAHISRYQPYADAVEASDRPAVIAMRESGQVAALVRKLDALGMAYEAHERGAFAVLVPAGDVDREEYAAAFQEAGVFA